MIKTNQLLAKVGALLLASCLVLSAQAEEFDGVPYTRIYTDANGTTHFEDVEFALSGVRLESGEMGGMASLLIGTEARMLSLEPGAFEDWHPAPDPQYLIVVQGFAEVGVSDGEVRRFGPGSVILMEDTGIGHTTRTVGDENHIGLMIPKAMD